MSKMIKYVVVMVALVAFGMATMAIAADFYVVKDASGKAAVVDKKPDDAKMILQGPFKTKEEAEKAMKAGKAEGSAKKPAKLPESGC
ncbi:MAG: hypothetical protein HY913_08925 [Desulfomonile tiedjei]|nr:hypothetical protein [Desulfomonile tiedjei]